jgi:large subunit ribosomal protein L6
MSKIGKMPITIPKEVTVEISGNMLLAKGPCGEESRMINRGVNVVLKDGVLFVSLKENTLTSSVWGLERALLSNIVTGVKEGFTKKLEMVGVGFRAKVDGEFLVLLAGFSHPVRKKIPGKIKVTVSEETKINIFGSNKQEVGQFSALVRKVRPPEPYKGKGIRYAGEIIRKKAGKAGKAGASAK